MQSQLYADYNEKKISKILIFSGTLPTLKFWVFLTIFPKLRGRKISKFRFMGQFLTLKNMVTKFFLTILTGVKILKFLMYSLNASCLNKVGDQCFQKLQTKDEKEVILKPKLGDAIVWNNLNKDGKPNPYSLHQGCPVKEGYKCIITKWFREKKI